MQAVEALSMRRWPASPLDEGNFLNLLPAILVQSGLLLLHSLTCYEDLDAEDIASLEHNCCVRMTSMQMDRWHHN